MSFGNQRKKFVPRKLPCNSPKDFVGSAINGSFFWLDRTKTCGSAIRLGSVCSLFFFPALLSLSEASFFLVRELSIFSIIVNKQLER
jgi:hypothetical protein